MNTNKLMNINKLINTNEINMSQLRNMNMETNKHGCGHGQRHTGTDA